MDWHSSSFGLLSNRQFRRFIATVFVSSCGNWLQNIALSWLALSLRNTPSSFAIISFLGSIPSLFFGFVGGWLADNFDRKFTLLLCQVANIAVAVVLAAGTLAGFVSFGLLAFLALVNGIATAISYPVYYTTMTDIVSVPELPKAIALNSLQFNLSRFIGPLLFGVLAGTAGLPGCFIANIASFAPFVIVLMTLPAMRSGPSGPPRGFSEDVLSALRYARGRRPIARTLVVTTAYSLLVLPFFGMLPYVIKNVLADDTGIVGIVMGAAGAGAISGALAISMLSRDRRDIARRFVTSAILFSAGLLALAATYSLTAMTAATFFFGAFMVAFYSSANSLLHLLTDDGMRGRVVGLFSAAYLGIYPLGTLVMGFLTEQFPLHGVIAMQAVLSLAVLASMRAGRQVPSS